MKENNVKHISPNQAKQSQSKSTCRTWGLPKVVTAADNVSCDVCKQNFPDRGTLENHMQSHMPPTANSDDLQQHMQEKNKDMKENKDKPIFPTQAEQSQRLQKVDTVDGKASCDFCKQDFPDRGALEIHMQLHVP